MRYLVPRTCTRLLHDDADWETSMPLAAFRDEPVYVLLGDPGMGKTEAFKVEREALGADACCISARNFLSLDLSTRRREWEGKTLFIDGLDEVRAGQMDARTPFDRIRQRLDALGRPRFRLSCRAADWLGSNDLIHLKDVSPTAEVEVLNLDPLSEEAIADILVFRAAISDADKFIVNARQRGIQGLLSNPQSLLMIAESVAGGAEWPSSRLEVFERFCSQVAKERNREHTRNWGATKEGKILDAAGRLCAIQLLTGSYGYVLTRQRVPQDYLTIDECVVKDDWLLRSALATKLFSSADDDTFSPVHRHIAEYLGARHLAGLIDAGLPAARVISLMTGHDGVVATELRGLSAWLAAICRKARSRLIETDPVGVGIYGDISGFSLPEKNALLAALKGQMKRIGNFWETGVAFGSLASRDMVDALKEHLTGSQRGNEDESFVQFILMILGLGDPFDELSEELLEIVRDSSWWATTRHAALDAYLHNRMDGGVQKHELAKLLADIGSGRVSDSDFGLLGTVLDKLYPNTLAPEEIWDYYLPARGIRMPNYDYVRFWERRLIERSNGDQVIRLLEEFVSRGYNLKIAIQSHYMEKLPLNLLCRALESQGDAAGSSTLYEWLGVGERLWRRSKDEPSLQSIRAWLEHRPDVQKNIILEGLLRESEPESDNLWNAQYQAMERLHGAAIPENFGTWCLEKSVSLADRNPPVAEHLLEMAVRSSRLEGQVRTSTVETLRATVAGNGRLKAKLEELLKPTPVDPRQLQWEREDREFAKQKRQKEAKWLEHVRSTEDALYENRAAPALLHQMAWAYYGSFAGSSGKRGREALEEYLFGEQKLVDAVLHSLRESIFRSDMPDDEEIISLLEQGQSHYLCLPLLAGLTDLDEAGEPFMRTLSDDRLRIALATYYCTPKAQESPGWYTDLVSWRPDIVAAVLIRYVGSEFRRKTKHARGLWEMATDEAHSEVARLASLPLLQAFPTRCRNNQLNLLNYLLRAAIQNADRESLEQLIDRKLALKSMNMPQRAHWLAVGILVSPDQYLQELEAFAGDSERRSLQVTTFFAEWRDEHLLDLRSAETLIHLIGKWYGPELQNLSGAITPAESASKFVGRLISKIAALPNIEANEALVKLVNDDTLAKWRFNLSWALSSQQVILRDASYTHPSPKEVTDTLSGGIPANVGDLAGLLIDVLNELTRHIPNSSSNSWRLFWNELNGKPDHPKYENSCRDALTVLLGPRLPNGFDLQSEAHYVHGNRSDIRVAYGGFNVPIEIKRNENRKLWSAIETQLIRKYTREPETGGFGIYLVFWFGADYTQAPPDGQRPESPQQLKYLLEKTLDREQRLKISVCVIDVSGT